MQQKNSRRDIPIGQNFPWAIFYPFSEFARGNGNIKIPAFANSVAGDPYQYYGTIEWPTNKVWFTVPLTGVYRMGATAKFSVANDTVRVGVGFHVGDNSAHLANPSVDNLTLANCIAYRDIFVSAPPASFHQSPYCYTEHLLNEGDIWSLVTICDAGLGATSFGEAAYGFIYYAGSIS